MYLFRIFVLCLWCDQSEFMAVSVVHYLWIGSGFIYDSCC